MSQCFKMKEDTEYAAKVREYSELRPKWSEVFPKVSELLGEKITQLRIDTERLIVDMDEIVMEENEKIFSKSGLIKNNSKKAREVGIGYKEIIKSVGLAEFKTLQYINFCYGVHRFQGETLTSFIDEGVMYFKTDFDLNKRCDGLVEAISEIDYQEKWLEVLRKNEEKKAS